MVEYIRATCVKCGMVRRAMLTRCPRCDYPMEWEAVQWPGSRSATHW